jgi:amino acid adenylation domain-containing protein
MSSIQTKNIFHARNIQNIYPLTPLQEGMYFNFLLNQAANTYFEQASYRLRGTLDVDKVLKSINMLFERHDILRTIFNSEKADKPLQVVLKDRPAAFYFEDIRSLGSKEEKEAFLIEFKKRDREQPFNLHKDALMRIKVLQIEECEYEFIWAHHHIIMDRWCMETLVNEYLVLYNGFIERKSCNLPPVKPFSTYIQWLEKQNKETSLNYWNQYLIYYETCESIPKTQVKSTDSYKKQREVFRVNADKTSKLNQLTGKYQVTLNTIIQTIWGILICKYIDSTDIVFGSVVSGRPSEIDGIEDMVGLFINTVPVRIKFSEHTTFDNLIQQIQVKNLESEPHHYNSLAEIQSSIGLNAIFDHIMAFQNLPSNSEPKGAVKNGEAEDTDITLTQAEIYEEVEYDFNIRIQPHTDLLVELLYNANVYDEVFIQNIPGHFNYILDQVLKDNEILVNNIVLLNPDEQLILHSFNPNVTAYPSDQTIQSLFEDQVALFPGSVAVVSGDTRLTYRDLNDRSNRLAHYLRDTHAVQADDFIGLVLDSSPDMIIAILGILKSGGAYVPVDPACPGERMGLLLADCGARLVLTSSAHLFKLSEHYQGAVFALDIQQEELSERTTNPVPVNISTDLAYLMYTSGSTGLPKGVTITHKSVARLVKNSNYADVKPTDKVLQLSSYAFDGSVFDIFASLLNGAGLYLIARDTLLSNHRLASYIQDHQITTLFITTALFNSLADLSPECLGVPDKLYFGGEEASLVHIRKALAHTRHRDSLVHVYGPTEGTTFSTYYVVENIEESALTIPIGKPLSHTTAYILNLQQELVPVGVAGEICLGGDGLSRGYWRQEELTAEKFVAHPFSQDPGARLYRTGDLGRWTASGDIEFLGRIDQQVKIRGYRIELGEIENILLKSGLPDQVLVTVHPDETSGKQLIAYYTGAGSSPAELRSYMEKRVPGYMIPQYFIHVPEFPLNNNGKIDKKRLPTVDREGQHIGSYLAAQTTLQQELVSIWESVLKKDKIGITDNFFSNGGDSIKAIRLVSTIRKKLEKEVEVKDIFTHQDIAELSGYIESLPARAEAGNATGYQAALQELDLQKQALLADSSLSEQLPADWEDFFPMSDIQKGMFYYSQLHEGSAVYHDQIYYQIKDADFKPELFKESFSYLVERHTLLRTSFYLIEFPEPLQVVHRHREETLDIQFGDLRHLQTGDQKTYLLSYLDQDRARGFSAHQKGLWRLRVFRLSEEEYGILFIVHHAIIDGWSEASLRTELSNVYYSLKEGIAYKQPKLKATYKDFIIDQHVYRQSDTGVNFWKNELNLYKRTSLPFNKMPNTYACKEETTNVYLFSIDSKLSQSLLETVDKLRINIKDLYLAAFIYLIKTVSNTDDITIGLVSNSRPGIEDGDKILGCFLNTIPFRTTVNPDIKIKDLIKQVSDKVNLVKQHDKLSLQEILKAAGEETTTQNPVYDIIFNYLDFHITEEVHQKTTLTESITNSFVKTNTYFDFTIHKSADSFTGHIIYSSALYAEESLKRISAYFQNILMQFLNPNQTIFPQNILSKPELTKILYEFNNTTTSYPSNKTIQELFELQVQKTPNAVAVVFDDKSLTYQELNKMSNQLAHYLRSQYGIKADSRIGLLLSRSANIIIGIIAILKSGAAYVPIDPEHPIDRIRYIQRDSTVELILTEQQQSGLIDNSTEYFIIDQDVAGLHASSENNPVSINKASDLAYVMYTSGSTGEPKGVAIAHKNVVRLVKDTNYTAIKENDRIIQLSNYAFDGSVFDIFSTLLNGGSLHIASKEVVLSNHLLVDFIETHQINIMFITTALFNSILDISPAVISYFDKLYFGGEEASLSHIRKALAHRKNKDSIVHVYGPTESTTFSTYHVIESLTENASSVPIGKPISNTTAFILDRQQQPSPIGVSGEIYLGGDGLARGYLNKADLTDQKFKIHSHLTASGIRLYATGDMGRWTVDGNIEFLGRADRQIKIRGHRIELGEVENILLTYNLLEKAYLLVREDSKGGKQLVAYYISKTTIKSSEIKTFLKERLPDYMIPAHFVQVEDLPLNANGKVDERRLPIPLNLKLTDSSLYLKPTNKIEERLVSIWENVLGIDKIGINDNFFEIGGHSLTATQAVARIHKEFDTKISIRNLFANPTIAELSEIISAISWTKKSVTEDFENDIEGIIL